MAGSKKKGVKQKEYPISGIVSLKENPDAFYEEYPCWRFSRTDTTHWAFTQEKIQDIIWSEILPYLRSIETRKWKEILLVAKKQNHSINVNELNKVARDRLDEMHIETESLISLRLQGTHRIYGYITGKGFHILWFDSNHGDNSTCVCRSTLKHT